LLADGDTAVVWLLFMVGVPLSFFPNLIVAVESRSKGSKRPVPFAWLFAIEPLCFSIFEPAVLSSD
jgi:hypothetical protein